MFQQYENLISKLKQQKHNFCKEIFQQGYAHGCTCNNFQRKYKLAYISLPLVHHYLTNIMNQQTHSSTETDSVVLQAPAYDPQIDDPIR